MGDEYFLEKQEVDMADLKQISENLIKGDLNRTMELVKEALDEGQDAQTILNGGLLPGMSVVGDKFKNNEFFLPDVLISAKTMNESIEILRPAFKKTAISDGGTIVLGTVLGDVHDIGKNMVRMMMEANGFNVVDVGIDVPVDRFIEAARQNGAQLIGLSGLLSTTIPVMRDVVDALKSSELKDRVKLMVGGAPVTQAFANEIGADAYGSDAVVAAEKAKTLIGKI